MKNKIHIIYLLFFINKLYDQFYFLNYIILTIIITLNNAFYYYTILFLVTLQILAFFTLFYFKETIYNFSDTYLPDTIYQTLRNGNEYFLCV